MSDEVSLACAAYILIDALHDDHKRPRRWWIHEMYRERSDLVNMLKNQEISGHYKNFTRMSATDFEYVMNLIGPKIERRNTTFRGAVSVQDRLAVTLRYLATGDSFTSLQYLFRISKQAISSIIPEVCQALIGALKEQIKMPTNRDEWVECSKEFEKLWHFPHVIGAIDGKHILIQCPFNSGAEYYNYKSQFSIVLLALVDAQYNFMYVHIGTQGRISDGGVLQGCSLKRMMDEKSLNLPEPVSLQNRNRLLPFHFLGDAAFPLGENLMKPYAGTHSKGSKERVFNYRLSRGRRVVENAFGILASVFRVLRKPVLLQPEKVETIVMTVVLLHNFLRRSSSCSVYTPQGTFDNENTETGEVIPGTWRSEAEGTSFRPLHTTARRSAANFKENREELAHYFLNEGKIPWQDMYA